MDHKMHDMGEMRDNCCGVEPESKKKVMYYPSIDLSSKKLPELKGKKYGDTVEIHIKGKIGGIREDYDDKTQANYEIKIMECGMKGKVSKDNYDKMSEEDKNKADEKEVMGEY